MEFEQPKIEVRISSHKYLALSVCFSPDQTKLCSTGKDKKVILTNLQDYKTQKVFIGHEKAIFGSDFSSNGISLATASYDKTVRIWNVESEDGNSTILKGNLRGCVFCVRFFHGDPTKVVSGSSDRVINIWSVERKKEISTLRGNESRVRCIDILTDNQTIVSGDYGKLRIWDFRSGKCVQILDHHKESVLSVQFHPNTFSLASGSADKTIKIFDFRTFQLLQNYQEHTKYVRSVCFHPSGKFLVSGSSDSTIKIFDLSQKKVLYTLSDQYTVWSVKFSPDGKYFASGGKDNKVFLWNFPLGRIFCDYKDIDEGERVKYLIEEDLLGSVNENDDCCERNVLEIRIDDFYIKLYCYKFFLCERKI